MCCELYKRRRPFERTLTYRCLSHSSPCIREAGHDNWSNAWSVSRTVLTSIYCVGYISPVLHDAAFFRLEELLPFVS